MSPLNDIEGTLMHLMYGYNYQVAFGSEMFENCLDTNDFLTRLKHRYPNSKLEAAQLVLMDKKDVMAAINFGLNYRGDAGAGLMLDGKKELELAAAQSIYREIVAHLIDTAREIFSCPEYYELPVYPIFWGYQFAVFLDSGNCVFIYGASSD